MSAAATKVQALLLLEAARSSKGSEREKLFGDAAFTIDELIRQREILLAIAARVANSSAPEDLRREANAAVRRCGAAQ